MGVGEEKRLTVQHPGTNLDGVKDYNEAVVFDVVRRRGPISRRRIADTSGLTFQTVSNITQRLMRSGDIEEAPDTAGSGTRRSRTYRANEDAAYAVGVHLDRSTLSLVLMNVSARVLASVKTAVAPSDGPGVVLPLIEGLVRQLVEEADVSWERILGAGIGVPGPLDREVGRLLQVPNFEGWENFALRQELEELLSLPVTLDSDTTAAALGEKWGGLGVNVPNFVYVYLGVGIGAGIVADDRACHGRGGNTGQIGHVQIDPDGPPCFCGKRGCLEVYATPWAILREARQAVLDMEPLGANRSPAWPAKFEDVVSSEDPLFEGVVRRAGDRLGAAVSGLVAILDPELVVLGGPATRLVGAPFKEAMERTLPISSMPNKPLPRVELSALDSDAAGPIGAAALVLHDAYSPSVRRLSPS
jgi:predicted NBD/HSP70 family sugar kinase